MARFLVAAAAVVVVGAAARAGGPPPVYVVVDTVTVEASGGPERVTIQGSFIRLTGGPGYRYGKPVRGFVRLALDETKASECRAEWKEWAKAAGTGKVVAVGMCGEAGTLLTATIHDAGDGAAGPDGTYTPGHLQKLSPPGGDWSREEPVKALLTFVRDRTAARTVRE